MNTKQIREIGYTQIINVPFELEPKDFEFSTSCSFIIKGSSDNALQVELTDVECMKNNLLGKDIKNKRDNIMGYKYIEIIYCLHIHHQLHRWETSSDNHFIASPSIH